MMNLTPDQAGKIFDLKEKMHADTAAMRKQMMVKHAELAALWKMEKPDKTAIQAKQKELNTLRDQMQEKMTAFRLEAKKIAPNFEWAWAWAWAMAAAWAKAAWAWELAPVKVWDTVVAWAWAPVLERRRRTSTDYACACASSASGQVGLLNHNVS